jgi:hypothetical protein
MAESSNNPVDALLGLIQSQLLDVNTCIPATIVSYAEGVARVAPTGKKRFADGDALDYPIIPNVRVCWPSFAGGLAGIRGPVREGDPCLLVFSQQAVDGSDDRRMFDLQDAYAIMCNIGTVGKSDSVNDNDMTMYFGPAYIRLTEGGQLLINAPGGTTIDTPDTTHTGNVKTKGNTAIDGTTLSKGTITGQGGMGITGSGGGGATVAITGSVTQSGGSLTSNGIVLHTHTHSGVQPGPGSTGGPQ